MSATGELRWRLVAPWWRWERQHQEAGVDPRDTWPVFQKYDTANLVNEFVKQPQHSLKFDEQADRVFNVDLMPAPKPLAALLAGHRSRFFAPRTKSNPAGDPLDAKLSPTGLRKLYRSVHNRFYLVVTELHCPAPGFPRVGHDAICQAGLVVRRRSFMYPEGTKKQAAQLLRELTSLRTQLGALEQTTPLRPCAADRRARLLAQMAADGSLATKQAELEEQIAAKQRELTAWSKDAGVVPMHEGWFRDGKLAAIGAWQPVEEEPRDMLEAWFPLYYLFPDATNPDHDARDRTIYFGVVPDGGSDTDARGVPRFDSDHLYEIRCFVRRHKTECPRKDTVPDCHGDLAWSRPTESYRLAPVNDLRGTAQRPLTITMPDLGALAAEAATLPFGAASPMRVVQPQSLDFSVNDGKPESPQVGDKRICFFAIPLITIVAMFLLNLFLPIVVFLFGLFFLLQLKFCIPPSFSIDAGLQAELKAIPPSVNVDTDFSVNVDIGGGVTKTVTAAILQADLGTVVAKGSADFSGAVGSPQYELDTATFSNAALLPVGQAFAGAADAKLAAQVETTGPDFTSGLEFEARVTSVKEVV